MTEDAAAAGKSWRDGQKDDFDRKPGIRSKLSIELGEEGQASDGAVGKIRRCSICARIIRCLTSPCRKVTQKFIVYFDKKTREVIAKQNEWLQFGERSERQVILWRRSLVFREQERIALKKRYPHRWVFLTKVLVKFLGNARQTAGFWLNEAIGRVDSRTGLPRRLLETYTFTSLQANTMHGYVYKAVKGIFIEDKDDEPDGLKRQISPTNLKRANSPAASKRQIPPPKSPVQGLEGGQFVCIKVRMKHVGNVNSLPLSAAHKVLRKHVLMNSGNILRRGLGHLMTAFAGRKRFGHDCLVKQLAVYDSPEFFVEVVEYIGGGSLKHYLEEANVVGLDEYVCNHIMSRLLRAVYYLHQRKLMHRDVRSDQILIPKEKSKMLLDQVKLADFWCMAEIPKNGVLIEEPHPVDIACTAPEVLLSGEWSAKADAWSVGCVFFELLYGHMPYGGSGDALVQRVCTKQPEFEKIGRNVSPSALELMKALLRKQRGSRSTVEAAITHSWLKEFKGEKKKLRQHTEEKLIRHVKLVGRPPACRRGMPATNLLVATPGLFNCGFCSFMGQTAASMEFEIMGNQESQWYWVTRIVVSLWGQKENPHKIKLSTCPVANAPWEHIAETSVESAAAFEAVVLVDCPLRHARLQFTGNFGGNLGIALKKISFYGYETRAMSLVVDLDTIKYINGTSRKDVISNILEEHVNTIIHKTIVNRLEPGERIGTSLKRYLKLRCVFTGLQSSQTSLEIPLKIPEGCPEITAALLTLPYHATVPPHGIAPRVRMSLVDRGKGDEVKETKKALFHSHNLDDTGWKLNEVHRKGFSYLTRQFIRNLKLDVGENLSIEMVFNNGAGFVHIPADIGLTFFYVPELESDVSDVEDNAKEARVDRRRAGLMILQSQLVDKPEEEEQEVKANKVEERLAHIAGIQQHDDLNSEDTASVQLEETLTADHTHNQRVDLYGYIGHGVPRTNEMRCWISPPMDFQPGYGDFAPDYSAHETEDDEFGDWEDFGPEGDGQAEELAKADDLGKGRKKWWTLKGSFDGTDSSSSTIDVAGHGGDDGDEKEVHLVTLNIVIVGAHGLRNTDEIGFSDPYCAYVVPGRPDLDDRTMRKDNTLDPVWNHEVTFENLKTTDEINFTVYDDDVDNDEEEDNKLARELGAEHEPEVLGRVSIDVHRILHKELFGKQQFDLQGAGNDEHGMPCHASLTLDIDKDVAGHEPEPNHRQVSPGQGSVLWPPKEHDDEEVEIALQHAKLLLLERQKEQTAQIQMRNAKRQQFLRQAATARRSPGSSMLEAICEAPCTAIMDNEDCTQENIIEFTQACCVEDDGEYDEDGEYQEGAFVHQQLAPVEHYPPSATRGDDEEFVESGNTFDDD